MKVTKKEEMGEKTGINVEEERRKYKKTYQEPLERKKQDISSVIYIYFSVCQVLMTIMIKQITKLKPTHIHTHTSKHSGGCAGEF